MNDVMVIKILLFFFHHIYLFLECVTTHVKEQIITNLGNWFRNSRDWQGGCKRSYEGMHLCLYVPAYLIK